MEYENIKSPSSFYHFVLTGGPCGGKTTAITRLVKKLKSYNINVIITHEAATMVFAKFRNRTLQDTDEQMIEQQLEILKLQMYNETQARCMIAQCHSNGINVIISDRGLLDGAAFINKELWEKTVEKFGSSLESLVFDKKRYTSIFHLVTTALGAHEFYTIENNCERLHTAEESILSDQRLIEVYKLHPDVQIIHNQGGFDLKMHQLENAILNRIQQFSSSATKTSLLYNPLQSIYNFHDITNNQFNFYRQWQKQISSSTTTNDEETLLSNENTKTNGIICSI